MSQKLDQNELENVNGGACEEKPHEIIEQKVEIRYKIPSTGKKNNRVVVFPIYADTEKDVYGITLEAKIKNWCKEHGCEMIWYKKV